MADGRYQLAPYQTVESSFPQRYPKTNSFYVKWGGLNSFYEIVLFFTGDEVTLFIYER